jgi:glycosyltransferase involved in cell wall biosynthesis
MRICFIGHQATKEGAGRFLLDQVDYLQAKGFTVFAILPQKGMLCDALAQRGVEFQVISNFWWVKSRSDIAEPDYGHTLDAARKMAIWFQRWKVDLVYTQTLVAPAGALGAALAGKPHVWHIHEFAYNPECIEMAIPKPCLARLMEITSNLVVFNSKAVASEWDGYLSAVKTGIVYNWVSEPNNVVSEMRVDNAVRGFIEDHGGFAMAMIGSVQPWKRQMDAIKAVAILVEQGFNVKLLIVGPFINEAYREEANTFIQRKSLTGRVRLMGYVENPAALMRSAKVTLVCSRLEPFGRVTIESMAQGVSVIGADSGGTSEIIHDGVNGLLFPVGNIVELVAQIRRLIQDEPFRQKLGFNAKVRAEQFSSAEKSMASLLGQLKNLVGTANPSWPLGESFGSGMASSQLINPAMLSVRDLGKLLLGKFMRRLRKLT